MGRNNKNIGLAVIEIDINNSIKGLREIFNLDADFTENEEYYRDDTLKLGFNNEADRIIDELSKDEKFNNMAIEEQVEAIITYSSYFLLNNSTYCGGYETTLTQIEHCDTLVLSIAYHTGT